MSLFADVTFFEVAMSLLAVGIIERVWLSLPESVVGPEGWLWRTEPVD